MHGEDLVSNTTLWDQILDSVLPWLQEKLTIAWNFTVGASLWITLIGCMMLIIIYAATRDEKYKTKATVTFLANIFIRVIAAVI